MIKMVIDSDISPVTVEKSVLWIYKPSDFFGPWGLWHHIVVDDKEVIHNGMRRTWTVKPEENISESLEGFTVDTIIVANGVQLNGTEDGQLGHFRTGGFDIWHVRIYDNITACQKLMIHEEDFHQIQVKVSSLGLLLSSLRKFIF